MDFSGRRTSFGPGTTREAVRAFLIEVCGIVCRPRGPWSDGGWTVPSLPSPR